MAKKCGKCDKIVYPAEELKCLDKVSCKIKKIVNAGGYLDFVL